MRYEVRHVSTLKYAAPVARARFNLRLKPRLRAGQRIESERLELSPKPSEREDQPGPYWVTTTQTGFDTALKTLEVTSEFVIDVAPPPAPGPAPLLATVRAQALEDADLGDLAPAPYLFASRIATLSEEITGWAAPRLDPASDTIAAVSTLMAALHGEFTYAPGATDSRTPPQDAFAARHGVCQDFHPCP